VSGHRTVYVTHRPPVHRQMAIEAAPPELEIDLLVSPTPGELLEAVGSAEFLISERSGAVEAAVVERGRSLRLIQRIGSQVHDIDLEAARRCGVPVCTWPLPSSARVAEHVIMQMLTLLKRGREAAAIVLEAGEQWGPPRRSDADTFAINWSGLSGVRQLGGSTIGIVGFGEIGTEVAGILGSFGATVLYYRRSRLPSWAEERLGVGYADLAALLARSDVVCVLLPHTPDTEGSVDASFVEQMRPGSYLVSSGASTLLDEEAVARAYRSGHLAGVATDAYQWEPVRADNPLVALASDPRSNVVLTPHSALAGLVVDVDFWRPEYTNLVAMLDGRPLQHRVA